MKLKQLKVQSKEDERVLLDDNLRPIWMLLHYNGLLPDLTLRREKNQLLRTIRFAFTFLVTLLICSIAAHELVQLFLVMLSNRDLLNMTNTFYILLTYLSALAHEYQFLKHIKEFQQFFKHWKKIEMQCTNSMIGVKKKRTKITIIYSFYLIILIWTSTIAFAWNILEPDQVIFPSHWSFLRDAMDIRLLAGIMGMSFYFSHFYQLLAEAVPAMFFYHAGRAVDGLRADLQHLSTTSSASRDNEPLRRVWQSYELIVESVSRANELFEATIFSTLSMLFLLMSISIIQIFQMTTRSTVMAVGLLGYFMTGVVRLIVTNQLMSGLNLSCDRLRADVAAVLSENWYLLPEENRLFLVSFQQRLHKDQLAAAPFDLFIVNPTNLLSMLSLIVTYTVVLFQFKGPST